MPGMGWRYGSRWGAYYTDKGVDRSKVERDTRNLLAQATQGDASAGSHVGKHIPLLLGGKVVGNLWEDVDLKTLDVGAYSVGSFRVKVELVHNGKVVGMVWLSE